MTEPIGPVPHGFGWVLDIEPEKSEGLDMAVFCADTDDGLIKTHFLLNSENGITVTRRNKNQVALLLTGQDARDNLIDILNGHHPTEETTFVPFKPDD